MQPTEKIKVYIDTKEGKTICICVRANKGSGKPCEKTCEKAEVFRDRFCGWENVMKRDRFGN